MSMFVYICMCMYVCLGVHVCAFAHVCGGRSVLRCLFEPLHKALFCFSSTVLSIPVLSATMLCTRFGIG